MNLKCMLGICTLLFVPAAGFAAGRSDVADAAMRGDKAAVRTLIEQHADVNAIQPDGATALHWAAWHGNAEMVQLILRHQPELENIDNDFKATPLGWAIHGSENGWHREKGDYASTVEALIKAGAKPPDTIEGSEVVREVLRKYRTA